MRNKRSIGAILKNDFYFFHAQEAVEKAIKAVLVLNGVPFGRTHDLVEPGYRAEEAVSDLPFAIDRLIRLNPCAVAFRYGEPAVDPEADVGLSDRPPPPLSLRGPGAHWR